MYYTHNDQLEHVKVTLSESGSTYTLDNLRPYTEYSVYVTAVKLIATTGRSLEGEKSRIVTARTLAGRKLLNHTQLTVTMTLINILEPIIITYNEDTRPNSTMNSEHLLVERNTIVVELPTVSSQNGPFRYSVYNILTIIDRCYFLLVTCTLLYIQPVIK